MSHFDPEKFNNLRQTRWIGESFYHFDAIGSTNTFLKERQSPDQLPSGTVALTDFQSAGRGRLGRTWVAPAGSSLLVSVLFRPKFPTQHATWLTMIAGLAAVEAVKAVANIDLALKWPNDVMARGDDGIWRKTGGILLEAETNGDRLSHAIIGMGLNVNLNEADLPEANTPPTSLRIVTGQPLDREALLARWVEALERLVDSAELGHSPQPAWNDTLITLNQHVTVSGAITLTGTAIGTNDWGQLLVQDADGKVHAVSAGDVSLRSK